LIVALRNRNTFRRSDGLVTFRAALRSLEPVKAELAPAEYPLWPRYHNQDQERRINHKPIIIDSARKLAQKLRQKRNYQCAHHRSRNRTHAAEHDHNDDLE
jgi:hypothetical protein